MMRGRPITMPYPWDHLAYYHNGARHLAKAMDISLQTLHSYSHGKRKMRPHTEALFNRLVKEMEENYAK